MSETPEFIAQSKKLFDAATLQHVINILAQDPTCGVIVRGTGGVRKLRVALEGRGKSGGARVIYFYHNENMPLFLLTAFAKKDKADLSGEERQAFGQFVKQLVRSYGRKS